MFLENNDISRISGRNIAKKKLMMIVCLYKRVKRDINFKYSCQVKSYLDVLDVVLPIVLRLNPFCYTVSSPFAHHRRHLRIQKKVMLHEIKIKTEEKRVLCRGL